MKNEPIANNPVADEDDAEVDLSKIEREPYETLELAMPQKAMQALRRAAEYYGLPCEALARQYIGVGLREAAREYFSEQAMWATGDALRARMDATEAEEVLRDIRARFKPGAPTLPRGREVDR